MQESPNKMKIPLNSCSIALATNHCFTAHAKISSGTMSAQNISVILVHNERRGFSPEGGMLGCIDSHVQMKMVVQQAIRMSNSDLVFGWRDGEIAGTIDIGSDDTVVLCHSIDLRAALKLSHEAGFMPRYTHDL